ncbi:MAG TPA: bi-domain-containing oxidoreductase [Blastocatellia bacterium]|nr:bi-domain-containing oxidoreductase [Blastocatellia bacterium]
MKQVVQNYRTGKLEVEELPQPLVRPGGVVVRTAFSLISAGTERSAVETARNSLVGKARSRPDLVKQVIDSVKREGLASAYQKVTARLNQIKPLGYSTSGIVVEIGPGVSGFNTGDRVACAGAGYASHAEFNFVPANLCAKVPDGVFLEAACYATLGSISLHGIRQAEPRLGETVAVIGLGLVGQLTVQMLKAAGCQVIGVDPDPQACDRAIGSNADLVALDPTRARIACETLTDGRGADSVIITAGTKSNGPVELAGDLARDRARVVVVGLVGIDVPRHTYYQKEIELRLSRSYGPGRYDPQYEEKGIDYPIGYVRWTEQRNMDAFLRFVAGGKVDPVSLTTHRFKIEQAAEAYDLILGKGGFDANAVATDGGGFVQPVVAAESISGPEGPETVEAGPPDGPGSAPGTAPAKGYRCGVVLEYAQSEPAGYPAAYLRPGKSQRGPNEVLGVAFAGAGGFARGVLLPILARAPRISLTGVATASGLSAKNTAGQFKFQYAAGGCKQLIDDPETNCVFIATRHDSHHSLAIECLNGGKSVFVEKPLAITPEGLELAVTAARNTGRLLFVGYNRRFAPIARQVKSLFEGGRGQFSIVYRINAGQMPAGHWTLDPDEGGGRIIGEVCHFVDFVQYITDSLPARVFARAVNLSGAAGFDDDSVAITLGMTGGSVASIIYVASGDKAVAKERIEIFRDRSVAFIDDFKTGEFVRDGKTKRLGNGKQDKGHAAEIGAFLAAARGETGTPLTIESLAATSRATFAINQSIRTGRSIELSSVVPWSEEPAGC